MKKGISEDVLRQLAEAKPSREETDPSAALKEIASRIHKLSYRDMLLLATMIHESLGEQHVVSKLDLVDAILEGARAAAATPVGKS